MARLLNRRNLFSSLIGQAVDSESILRALRYCRSRMAVNEGKIIHSMLVKQGSCQDVFIANNLIALYTDLEIYDDALKLFDEMPNRNVVSWTALISAYMRAYKPSEAIRVFVQMVVGGVEVPNAHTCSAALKACGMAGNLEIGKWIHEQVLRGGMQFDRVLLNSVIDMYLKCGSVAKARRVFDELRVVHSTSWNMMISGYFRSGNVTEAESLFWQVPKPDVVAYNTMIAGFAHVESPKALSYFRMIHEEGLKLDDFTFPSALNVCSSLKCMDMGKQIHGYIVKCGFLFSSFIASSLIDMYSSCNLMAEAWQFYHELLNCNDFNGDLLPLSNTLLSGFATNEHNRDALNLISEMHKLVVGLDAFTLSSALIVCRNLQNMRFGLQIHGLITVYGFHLDHIIGSVLIDLYARFGNLNDALRLFHGISHKDVIAWTGLISGCVEQGSNGLAFELFRQMNCLHVEVDHIVISNILKACSVLAWVQGGKQVHAYSIKHGVDSEKVNVVSFIDFYSKCGIIEDGFRIFESIDEKG